MRRAPSLYLRNELVTQSLHSEAGGCICVEPYSVIKEL